jgi:hypothetical protein
MVEGVGMSVVDSLLFRVPVPVRRNVERTWDMHHLLSSGNVVIYVLWRKQGETMVPVKGEVKYWKDGHVNKFEVPAECIIPVDDVSDRNGL